ncbi:hypothetical protein WH95_02150 [Kiloniella litopenaei]|uniref:Uncharacterized protein n=1 Tax=Kiloniella litopenaei TaxID=1549748 RepID=A0A0M2RCM1_9PROT|nr:hypothetical protein WH95_02150 [Kiloniella litopenaei]
MNRLKVFGVANFVGKDGEPGNNLSAFRRQFGGFQLFIACVYFQVIPFLAKITEVSWFEGVLLWY